MCGITAYIGHREALAILVAALKRLEYRGYDSAGVCVVEQPAAASHSGAGAEAPPPAPAAALRIVKRLGRVANLEAAAATAAGGLRGTAGIGHTRWATHGAPSDVNAHPHADAALGVAVVHNGIIENYAALKQALMLEGYVFVSETDTEVLAHLLADVRKKRPALSPEGVVRAALRLVTGAFGVAVVFADRPDLLIGARHGSPLLLGVGQGEFFLASDASAVVEHTSVVEYLAERELVAVTRGGYTITSLDAAEADADEGGREPKLQRLELTLGAIEKGGFAHFMLKEIYEQPAALRNAMRGRVLAESGEIRLGGLAGEPMRRLCAARRIIIVGCGTSFHSAQVGEYLVEGLARVPVDVELASEFRYRRPILRAGEDVLIAISQSGETADTLAAVREAKAHGVLTLGLVNAVGSSIARETDAGCYLHVGPEIGVASTKAFTAQVLVLAMLALALAREKGAIDAEQLRTKVSELELLPALVERCLEEAPRVCEVAREYRFASSFLFLGRGSNFPVALEGALKLKECSYIHAEGMAAAELKHGPLALVERFMPVVAIAPRDDPVYDKLRANVEEVLARGGSVLLITQPGADARLEARCDAVLSVPAAPDWLAPVVHAVPLQLLAYHLAVRRGCDVDRPRNLAKSVTVE
jgi:glucosamine--fructose-6-phosphate aminotransferase (isomerizing)